MHIAVDGWSFIERPWSVEAMHLLEWLGALREADPSLRLSVLHPDGALPALPLEIGSQATGIPVSLAGRLRYEQRALPHLAGKLGADWLLIPRRAAPLVSMVPVAILLSGGQPDRGGPFLRRLCDALGRAGADGAALQLRYADLAESGPPDERIRQVPPFLGDAFRPLASPAIAALSQWDLQPGYVLACGVSPGQLAPLLAAWSWVEASVGEAAPLVLVGLDPAAVESARAQAASLGVEGALRIVSPGRIGELAELFRGAAACLQLGAEASGQPLRWALGCGVPIAGIDWPDTASIVGQAGYLVPAGEARSLGAACLTLLVEEPVSSDLRQKGLLRATAMRGPAPLEAWLRVFREALQ